MGKNKAPPRKGRQPVEEEEDDEELADDADVSDLIARNPALAAALQERLGMLIGKPSGYAQSLPADVKRRVKALKNLQTQHSQLEREYREELLALERKYLDKYKPLYSKRLQIISGEVEPTDAECEREDSDVEEGLQNATIQEIDESNQPVNPIKGVPDFWYTTLASHPMLAELIQEHDEPALKALTDVTLHYTEDNHAFVISFLFADNEYFNNKVLTKTYHVENKAGTYDDIVYSHAEGTVIDWKKDKNLTVKVETKKQRHKGSKKTRVVKREVPQPSFFTFFAPPKIPEEDDEEVDPELEDQIEQDFELGEVFKTKIIKHAVDWFTGKALENYDEQGYDDDEYGDEDDGEDEGDEDEDDDDEPSTGNRALPGGEKPADCQQQ